MRTIERLRYLREMLLHREPFVETIPSHIVYGEICVPWVPHNLKVVLQKDIRWKNDTIELA
jgi:hypothetical protein